MPVPPFLALCQVGQRQSGLDRCATSHEVDDQHHDCPHQQHQHTPEQGGQPIRGDLPGVLQPGTIGGFHVDLVKLKEINPGEYEYDGAPNASRACRFILEHEQVKFTGRPLVEMMMSALEAAGLAVGVYSQANFSDRVMLTGFREGRMFTKPALGNND